MVVCIAEKNTFTPKADIYYVPKMLQQYLDQKLFFSNLSYVLDGGWSMETACAHSTRFAVYTHIPVWENYLRLDN